MRAGNPDADFSMAAGEFLEVYGNQRAEWDSVVTCFFIDTAPIVMEYLELLYDLIQPGGYWINLGTLASTLCVCVLVVMPCLTHPAIPSPSCGEQGHCCSIGRTLALVALMLATDRAWS